MSETSPRRWRPWVFVGPALVFVTGWLVVPAVRTLWMSLFDRTSERFVGLDNFTWVFTDDQVLVALRNNLFWLLGVTVFSTAIGLLLAVVADQMKSERVVRSLIMLPMAISFVGASVLWRLVYAFRPPGSEQIGLLNEAWTSIGGEPLAWLVQQPVNSFFLIVVMIWIQTGFAMVLLSAAVKGVPGELIEAARVDGANEMQTFWRLTLPSIKGSIAVVATTTGIVALKVYDIVKVTTDGNFGTSVVATEMFDQSFRFGEFGRGAALAVVLFVAIVPLMILHLRRFRREEARR